MKKNLLAALFLLLGTIVMAQTAAKFKVQGTVKDSTLREAMPYSTVLVRDSTQKYVVSTYTSDQGNFEFRLPSGTYTMIIGFTGYTPDSTVLKIGRENINYGTVYLKEGIEIGTVQILGQIVTTDIDKTSYNTAADPETPALTALEMMRKVPMLTVDNDDNILLKGQGNYKILVNGRTSGMMSKNYKDVLKAMPAGSIKRIDVITNPPAKYDAEGIGGIIDIITNRQAISGYNGSVNLGAGTDGSYRLGGYVNGQFGKFTITGDIYAGMYNPKNRAATNRSTRIDSMQIERYRIESQGASTHQSKNIGGNVEVSYEIDTANLLTVGFGIYNGGNTTEGWSVGQYFDRMGELTSRYRSQNRNNYNYLGINASLNYQHTFKRPDQTLTFSYVFDNSNDRSNNNTDLTNEFGNYPDPYMRRTVGTENGGRHEFQLDYFDPITKEHQIEAGLKYILNPSFTDNNYEIMRQGIWAPEDALKNDMDYTQHIGSFYGGYALKLKWLSAKVGFRGETTINQGVVKMRKNGEPDNYNIFNRYFNIVPYVTLNFKINEANSIRVGYNQRLRRPWIWYLNPYINDLNPTSVSSGNPNLESTLNHTINIDYSFYRPKWNVGVSATYYTSNNSIERISTLVKAGDRVGDKYIGRLWNRPENIGLSEGVSGNFYFGLRFMENKLTFGGNISANYSASKAPQFNLHNTSWNYNARLYMGANLWKNANFNGSIGYGSGSSGVQSQDGSYIYYNMSISQWFLDKKLQVSINANNPFENKRASDSESWGPGFYSKSNYEYYSSSFRVSAMWRFGKTEVGVKRAKRGLSGGEGGGEKGGSGGGM